MRRATSLRGGTAETITLLAAGIILGVAIGVGGCARADKAPTLPPARVDWAQAVAGPRQALVCGPWDDAQRRANTLLAEGWRAVPGTQAMASHWQSGFAPIYALVLEQRPRKAP